jgi:hypothetical protein
MIVITDLPKHALVHSKEIKKWLTEYIQTIERDHEMTKPVKRKLRNIQRVIDTIDDTGNKPF